MAQWHQGRRHLVGGDLTHPNAEGAQTVGTLLYMALIESYNQYRERARLQQVTLAQNKNH